MELHKSSKETALKEIFKIEGFLDHWPSRKVSAEQYLKIISKEKYSLSKELGLCAQSLSVLNRKLWPTKPKTNVRLCAHALQKYGFKYCSKCKLVYNIDCFHNNSSKQAGKDSYCSDCFNDMVRDYRRFYTAYRATRNK